MRERGLKYRRRPGRLHARGSLPMRERGLKYEQDEPLLVPALVAPHAGAWIEILSYLPVALYVNGRSPCGSVD